MNKGTHPVTQKSILKPESVLEFMKDQLDEKLQKDLTVQIPAVQPEITNA
jgi:hypothetical protein